MAERKYNPEARRIAIQGVLMREGTVSVETLAEQFGASVATIRRDLSALAEAGIARRTHGGAVFRALRGADQAFALREETDAREKQRIARRVVELIEPDMTLLMNDGSTVLAVAREIAAQNLEIMIVTAGVNVATFLAEASRATVYLLGGRVRKHSLGTTGLFAEEMLRGINADLAILACEAAPPNIGLTFSYEHDASLALAMSKRARTVVAVMASRKFELQDRFIALPMNDVDALVTDTVSAEVQKQLSEKGVDVLTADHTVDRIWNLMA